MFVPIRTYYDYENNSIYCESTSLGTYCVKNLNDWLLNFNVDFQEVVNESESMISTLSLDYNDEEINLQSETNEPFYVIFALDNCATPLLSMADLPYAKETVIDVSAKLYDQYDNVTIIIMPYNSTSCNGIICDSISEVENCVNNISLGSYNSWSLVELPMYTTSYYLEKNTEKFLFIYNSGNIGSVTDNDYELLVSELSQEENIHISFVMPTVSNFNVESYVKPYTEEYNGKMFYLSSDTVANEIYNYIYSDVTGFTPIQPDPSEDDDNPIEEEPNEELNSNYILSLGLKPVELKAPITKDSTIDSDEDGLTDCEELIQGSSLISWDENNNIILPSLAKVIGCNDEAININDLLVNFNFTDDILNEICEIKILPVRCNPMNKDTDWDFYTDYEEIIEHNTNPLNANFIISQSSLDFLTNNNYYYYSNFRDIYNENAKNQICVLIGNNVFGTKHDEVKVYKEAILSYFENINGESRDILQRVDTINYYVNVAVQIESLTNKIYVTSNKNDEIFELYKYLLNDYYDELINYKKNITNHQKLIEEEERLLKNFFNNRIVNENIFQLNRSDTIKCVMNFGDNMTKFVNIACITSTGVISLGNSVQDLLTVFNNERIIRNSMDMIDYITSHSRNYYLTEAANEIRIEMQSKFMEYLYEIGRIGLNLGVDLTDVGVRTVISELSSGGLLLIASIAVTDSIFGISNMSNIIIKSVANATLTDYYIDKLNNMKNNTREQYYAIYTNDLLYNIYDVCYCRINGEQIASGFGNIFVSCTNDCKNNIYAVENVLLDLTGGNI